MRHILLVCFKPTKNIDHQLSNLINLQCSGPCLDKFIKLEENNNNLELELLNQIIHQINKRSQGYISKTVHPKSLIEKHFEVNKKCRFLIKSGVRT